jgi:hypothetical protein
MYLLILDYGVGIHILHVYPNNDIAYRYFIKINKITYFSADKFTILSVV